MCSSRTVINRIVRTTGQCTPAASALCPVVNPTTGQVDRKNYYQWGAHWYEILLPVRQIKLYKGSVDKTSSSPFANSLQLRSHRVAGLGGCPTGPPVGGVTSTSTPALWPCTFCSDRVRPTVVKHGCLPSLYRSNWAHSDQLTTSHIRVTENSTSKTSKQLLWGVWS